MTDKAEAKRLADEAGNEIGKSDPQWEVIDAAIEMLRRWPDGEPVMCPGRPDSRCHYVAHCGQVCNKCGNIHDGSISEVSQALRAQSDGAPVAWLVEGWHDGTLIAHIVHLTLDEANNSASVFSTHYSTVRKLPLYTAPQSERIAALERENAALRKDAERYRWLVQNCTREVSNIGDLGLHFSCDFEHWDNVDAAIDAARSKT